MKELTEDRVKELFRYDGKYIKEHVQHEGSIKD